MKNSQLLPKIPPALRRLHGLYCNQGKAKLGDLIEASHIYIDPEPHYDNLNGGTYWYDLFIFVSAEIMNSIGFDDQKQLSEQISGDLDKTITDMENERVGTVHIKLADEADSDFQKAVPFTRRPKPRPEDVRLWGDGNRLRLFISHQNEHKSEANLLAEALEPFGVASFVAHDSIKPMKIWQKEILNGLMTMEVMVVLLTDGFHESVWTNQEIGFALGKGIPIACVKAGAQDPDGFIGTVQALKTPIENITSVAPELFRTLIEELGQEDRHKEILIDAFVSSKSYLDTMDNLKRLMQVVDTLNEADLNLIVEGYAQNNQLHTCGGIHTRGNWFKQYLESATGKEFEFVNGEIMELKPDIDDIEF